VEEMKERFSIKKLEVNNGGGGGRSVYFITFVEIYFLTMQKKKKNKNKTKKRKRDVEKIIDSWLHSSFIKVGWIDDFTVIITRYILVFVFVRMKYFKPLKISQGLSRITSVEFSPDGATILSLSKDGTAQIWDILLEKKIQVLQGDGDTVNNAHFSPDGNMIVSCSNDNTIRLWDVESWTVIKKIGGTFRSCDKCPLLARWKKYCI
ncbi:WD-40 repeat protein, partial [Reticulomyxa filosa]